MSGVSVAEAGVPKPEAGTPVMDAVGVSKVYRRHGLSAVQALDDVSLTVPSGRTVGVVGESGSGKSTLTRMILGLEEPTSGEVRYSGVPLSDMTKEQRRSYRHSVSAVFQNPFSSLSPRMRIDAVVTEQLAIEGVGSKEERLVRAREMLELVGLPKQLADRYPHQLSGGQRQRVAIARALIHDPRVLVLDEPTSALDVSVSAQVVNVLIRLQDELDLSYIFVAHDMRLVRHLAHSVVVLNHGRVVEAGPTAEVLDAPREEYTRSLLAASELESLRDV